MRRIQYIIVLFLLFHTACNGCKQYDLEYEEDRWGTDIAIDTSAGVALQGSITGFPVLSLQGQISKTVSGVDTAVLCALFVPAGSEPDTCAADIADHVVSQMTKALPQVHGRWVSCISCLVGVLYTMNVLSNSKKQVL